MSSPPVQSGNPALQHTKSPVQQLACKQYDMVSDAGGDVFIHPGVRHLLDVVY